MDVRPAGIHHVTAIASDPQANADFYLNALGMRLVKRTVNFDAPDTYHLYYGDRAGNPGTVMTFFPWPDAPRGRLGAGQATTTSFSVPEGSLGWWQRHLAALGVEATRPAERLEEDVLTLRDPDGLVIELVASADYHDTDPWDGGAVPLQHAIRGIRAVTLTEHDLEGTADMLSGTLGFELAAETGNRYRFHTTRSAEGVGTVVDVLADPRAKRGLVAAGTVHHVAYRAPDQPTQIGWQRSLAEEGVGVTEIRDRSYFTSIYFREPGGVLLEIATDGPGFDYDEPLLQLGRALKLPPWLEPNRAQIERHLPELRVGPADPAPAAQE
ncbi:ring-cleaving dioxygenase [Streptomonospora nanhaiensis]|uniref:Glyoxalase family protein n=1 Tax=Streptomonospora nanhaiensis TaxID=1323731 RepID=A0A853BRF3_9ACTN|nr:ring-cleaving dioxygenase [Streptomonospora nanhaiensis]MBV2365173.1 ring-cleaving dioxygenase [Streptomonospora nanhaiensis]MBV2366322.1 ring-cleaving dioxygenase [Streptomonospora nanhaiensis]MBX9387385.1 ring-cleaving dioxygenase [Streptomonospora nanhaiensis]NYI97444.1 glyoxalase family protein [Streptomonospora nanhaiensis]